ncbi:retinoblastoma-associated protein-like [Liolophura sinensis]|uniref:retinoblastoma-associated protein-like n=1 Tax=Liolophura sinensis TaxID=3198878 RepID=UPI003158BF92
MVFLVITVICLCLFSVNRESVLRALNPEGFDFNKRLAWALFLLAKGAYLGDSQELVLAFHFLLCCVEFVMRYTPAFQLLPPFDSLRIGNNNHVVEEAFLRKLCDHCNTSFEEVISVKKTYTDHFIHSLKNENGLLEMETLLKLYSTVYYSQKDIDEMLLLDHDEHLLPVYSQIKRSPTHKINPEVQMTPIRTALSTVQQLKKILSSGREGPSDKLKIFFKNCSKRPDETVADCVKQLEKEFIASLIKVTGEKHRSIGEQRFRMAVRLYYRVMEALLTSEQERLSQKDFSTLLNKDTFHRCLLACSTEVVMTAYGVSWNTCEQAMNSEESDFAFPWILVTFQLKAYDFYKVLESFIRAEPKLTKDIIRHLQGVENRILESIAWEEDSPLFEALYMCDVTQIAGSHPPNSDNNNVQGASAAELCLSPVCTRQTTPITPPGQVSNGSGLSSPSPRKNQECSPSHTPGTSPRSPSTPRRSQSLNLFFNKVCRLGYHRLQALCNFLDVPKDLQHKAWTCFEYCITHKPELLKNRHLDQIMMCSVYAMCKVQEKEIKFKTIVNMYKNLPHASQEVYKAAFISNSVHDTIIVFYNRIFMVALKSYILQFSGNKSSTPMLSPVPKAVNSPLVASPTYSLPGRKNFTVSPLKASPFKTPLSPSQMTPRTRALYSFGDIQGSSDKLQMINERMGAIKRISTQTTTRSKRLKFDQCDDPTPSNQTNVPTVIPVLLKKVPKGLVPPKEALTLNTADKDISSENMESAITSKVCDANTK